MELELLRHVDRREHQGGCSGWEVEGGEERGKILWDRKHYTLRSWMDKMHHTPQDGSIGAVVYSVLLPVCWL